MSQSAGITFWDRATLTGKREGRVNPFGSAFYSDLARDYGQKVDFSGARPNSFVSFEELCASLLDGMAEAGRLQGVDLLVVAHWLPNCVAYHSTTSYLTHRYALSAFTFAVSDQGTACALTGIKIINDYLASGKARKALLLMVDQDSLPTLPPPELAARTISNAVAGLLIEAPREGSIDIIDFCRISAPAGDSFPEQAAATAVECLARNGVSPQSVRTVSHPSLAPILATVLGADRAWSMPTEYLVTAPFFSEGWAEAGGWTTPYLMVVDYSFADLRLLLLRMSPAGKAP